MPEREPAVPTRRASNEWSAWAVVAATVVAVVATYLVYRPDRDVPFDLYDFSEFLPILGRSDSVLTNLRDIVTYYLDLGRFNLIPYLALVAKSQVWGTEVAAWQWFRFLTMWGVVALTFTVLRRMRLDRLGAMTGASVFLFAPPAADGWIRLTMAEPLGTIVLLLLCLAAITTSPREGRWRDSFLVGALGLLLVLTKEMLAAALFLPLVLMMAFEAESDWRPTRRFWTLATASLGAAAVALVPIALAALRAPDNVYRTHFGATLKPFGDVVAVWIRGTTPFEPFGALPGLAQGLLNVGFLLLLVFGWRLFARDPHWGRTGRRILLAGALLFPLVGAVSYMPWPAYARFYAIPYLLSLAILAGVALTSLNRSSRQLGLSGGAVWMLCLAAGATTAANDANRDVAERRLNVHIIQTAASPSFADSFFVASPGVPTVKAAGYGAMLARYGAVYGFRLPPTRDMTCGEALALVPMLPPRSILVSLPECGAMQPFDSTLSARFTAWTWSASPRRPDSVYVTIVRSAEK